MNQSLVTSKRRRRKKKKYRASYRKKRDGSADNDNDQNTTGNGTSNRRIRWNEEVEELVILECSKQYSGSHQSDHLVDNELPAYDPFNSFEYRNESMDPAVNLPLSPSPDDPYYNPSVSENGWFENNNNNSSSHSRHNNNHSSSSRRSAPQASSSSEQAISYNFHSLDDSTLTIAQPLANHENNNNKLDDSLIAILDAPPESSNYQNSLTASSQWVDKVGEEMKNRKLFAIQKEWDTNRRNSTGTSGTGTGTGHDDSNNINTRNEEKSTGHKKKVLVDEDTSYVMGAGNKFKVRIDARTFEKDKQQQQQPPTVTPSATMTRPQLSHHYHHQDHDNINNRSNNFKTEAPDLFKQHHQEATEYELNVDDLSLDTKETTDSRMNWKKDSYGGGTDDCGGFPRNDCHAFRPSDCGPIDLAKGFQASLSNYINAAVSDMKEGWNSLGKKWEENIPKLSEKGENPFLVNSFELDAMMDILKLEMNSIPNRMNNMGGTATDSCYAYNSSPFKGELPSCQPRYPS